ncbi:hypothetical protein C1645_840782, partial [Glomus cerebriforme]
MNQVIRDTLNTFDFILDDLLNIKIDLQGIDMAVSDGIPSSDEESVVDYRFTVRVLKLIWTSVALAICIYIKKNLNIHEICENNEVVNSAFRIWYLYYQWAEYLKLIVLGNYDLQKNALAAFGGLFASVTKTHYASSVCHFIGILEKFSRLEDKLCCAASIRIDHNEKQKGHFFAYDEALETFG